MGDFSFLAIPNIEGMRLGRYIQIVGICVVFGVSLFFALLYVFRYRNRRSASRHAQVFAEQTNELEQQLFVKRILAAKGKTKLTLFIDYLERFVTTTTYANLQELLISHGFASDEAQQLVQVVYTNAALSSALEEKINADISSGCNT